jgi:hypothetical protein
MAYLFLSHAASSEDSLKRVEAVAQALSDKGYEVFEYRRDIETGESWRVAVLTALLLCDVGVILNDERAGRRKWMRYERAILQARRTAPFGPCRLVEIDVAQPSDSAAIVDFVSSEAPPHRVDASRLQQRQLEMRELAADIDDVQCKLCVEILMAQQWIAGYLKSLHEFELQKLVGELASTPVTSPPDAAFSLLDRLEQIVAWMPTPSAYFIAKHIVRNPVDNLRVFLRALQGDNLRPQLLWLLSPLLVPLASVEGLIKLFSREVDVSKPLIVEAESDFEVGLAIRRAWGVERGPSFLAPIIFLDWLITSESEEDAVFNINQRVWTAVRRFLEADYLNEEALRREVGEAAPPLVSDNQNEGLWILVARESYCTQRVLTQIRTCFPDFPLVLTVPPGSSTDFIDVVRLASIPDDVRDHFERLDLESRG